MVLLLEELGVPVETHHHEVGGPGQAEIDIRYNTLLKTADNVMLYKYVVKNTARRHGKTVTFMPKPVFGDNGSGMHVHQSLWKGEKPKEELREIRSVPGSLSEALDALESDYSFLLEGNVFTADMLEQYVRLKRAQSDTVRLRPTPIEFALYYDA